jgi:acyl-CoA thioester hydrolase
MAMTHPSSPPPAFPWPDLAGRLVDGGHVLPVRVYYEDTDFSGVVYHASYLRFFERGRTDFLRLLGVGHAAMAAGAFGSARAFAVRTMTLDFRRPATIDDVLEVTTRRAALSGARIVLDQTIARAGEALVTASVTVAVIDGEGRPCRLPVSLRERLAEPAVRAAP